MSTWLCSSKSCSLDGHTLDNYDKVANVTCSYQSCPQCCVYVQGVESYYSQPLRFGMRYDHWAYTFRFTYIIRYPGSYLQRTVSPTTCLLGGNYTSAVRSQYGVPLLDAVYGHTMHIADSCHVGRADGKYITSHLCNRLLIMNANPKPSSPPWKLCATWSAPFPVYFDSRRLML